jgi:uncharacterized repeat protein (TIGR01451 family)
MHLCSDHIDVYHGKLGNNPNVTATAVNDLIVEGAHSCTTGVISASGGGYTGITGTAPTFTITDNDTASITLAKNASVASVGSAGSVINYTIQISNTGNVAATAITVTDTLVSVVCPTSGGNTIATLAPSTSETCAASYIATQADFDTNGGGDGDIDNSASASGSAGGVPVAASGSEAVLCTQNPALTLVKSANQAGPLTAGQTIVYSFLATNTGNVTLSNVSIDETAFNGTSPPSRHADQRGTDRCCATWRLVGFNGEQRRLDCFETGRFCPVPNQLHGDAKRRGCAAVGIASRPATGQNSAHDKAPGLYAFRCCNPPPPPRSA